MNGELSARQGAVLRALIEEYIGQGEPVGSGTLSRREDLEVSAATIRSELAELEERGLLVQPHTSAGRIPTDEAYRLYVDALVGRPALDPEQVGRLEEALAAGGDELPDVLGAASRELSRLTRQVGLVLSPELTRWVVGRIEFLFIDERRVVAVIVSQGGLVQHRMLTVERTIDRELLERVGRFLTDEFGGRTLTAMRRMLEERAGEERAAVDRLVRESIALGRRAVGDERHAAELFVDGASRLVGAPEFSDPDAVRSLLRTLEERDVLIELLGGLIDGRGVEVVIGRENPVADLARCSLVTAPYGPAGRPLGTVGIVGPTRMPYATAIALVGHLARALGSRLEPAPTDPEEGGEDPRKSGC